ncbi:STAS domain-containing protein [Microbacterium sp. SSW1-49]|uniref:STAS domain-containing protein n=1 Tax=Microbacterium croceum TaxID=2851645 RepID=A0ABT0FHK2_9MICO|nr:STAS domain-containing protein [Microbacterium croceum]MCK2037539.1 STAS domain-containing protein [Microbacterium croceum]
MRDNDHMAADEELRIDVHQTDADHVLITLAGRFDVAEATRVRTRLAASEVSGAGHLVIDLTDVTFVDSAGLAVLARARRDRVLQQGSVTLFRPASEDAMRVFRLTQFDEIFTIVARPDGNI